MRSVPTVLVLLLTLCALAGRLTAQPAQPFVDLTVSVSSYGPKILYQGELMSITGAETNRGNYFAAPDFTIAYGLTPDSTVGNADDIILGRTLEDEGLDPGETYAGEVAMHVPFTVAPGAYHLGAYINDGDSDAFEESSYDNNDWVSARADVIVKAATLFIDNAIRQIPARKNTVFTATPSGQPHRPTYRWEHQAAGTGGFLPLSDGGPYSGATTASLSLAGATRAMDGDRFRCIIRIVTEYSDSELASNVATLLVTKSPQTITFAPLPNRSYGEGPFRLAATASSKLPVSFALVSGPARLLGDTFEILGTGSVTIRATQEGDDDFEAAPPVERTFLVVKAPQKITFAPLPDIPYTDNPIPLVAISTSGLPVEFSVQSGPATVSGSFLRLTGAGRITVKASQPGDDNYAAATPVTRTFAVSTQGVSVSLGGLRQTYSGQPRHVSISTTVKSPVYVTYAGKLAAPIHAGTYLVLVRFLNGDAPIGAASLVVAKAPLLVRAPDLLRAVGTNNPPFPLSYTGFVNGEDSSVLDKKPVAATKAVKTSHPGEYPVTVSRGADNNYDFAYAPGSLTVRGFGGGYEALLYDPALTDGDGDHVPLGKLELTIPANSLAYTGKLTLAGEAAAIPLVGTLATATPFTSATGPWTRPANPKTSAPAYSLSFTLSEGTIQDIALTRAAAPYLDSLGDGVRLPDRLPNPGPVAYTLILSDPSPAFIPDDTRDFPRGAGHASATLNAASGLLALSGTLADGSKLTASTRPDSTRRHRLFVKPYGTRLHGYLSGTLALRPRAGSTGFQIADGLLLWAKPPSPAKPLDASYRAGFGPLDLIVSLDPWLPPVPKASPTLPQRLGLADSATTSGYFTITHGPALVDLGASANALPVAGTLDPAGAISAGGAAPTSWRMKVTPSTGAFTGSFTLRDQVAPLPANPVARTVTFSGILRQAPAGDTVIGGGFFLVPGLSKTDPQTSGEIRFTSETTAP